MRKQRMRTKFVQRLVLEEGDVLEYKNLDLLKKFLNERGKLLPRRLTGVTAKQQRDVGQAVKRARYLALLPSGGVR